MPKVIGSSPLPLGQAFCMPTLGMVLPSLNYPSLLSQVSATMGPGSTNRKCVWWWGIV